MLKKIVLFVNTFFLLTVALSVVNHAQDDSKKKASLAIGTVKEVDEKRIVVETETGKIDAVLIESTTYKRLPPDNLKLSAAQDAAFSEISIGDRVVVTGIFSDDKKEMSAKTVYLVKGSDIADAQKKRQEEWAARGISGRVTEINPATKEITVEMRSITGSTSEIKVTPKEDAKFLRYSPKSVKYADALESNFGDIQKDDMLRALGDRSADNTTFKAEEILTGAFVTVAGTVKSVDAANNQVTITDLKTKADVIIQVNADSLLKKYPQEQAERMARFQAMRQNGQTPQGDNRGGNRVSRGERSQRPGGARPGGRRMDINEMLNRFPTITIADLKEGDMIAASSPKGSDPTKLTAIKLLAGVEPFITMAQMQSARSGGGRRGGVSGGFSIPGLDSVEF